MWSEKKNEMHPATKENTKQKIYYHFLILTCKQEDSWLTQSYLNSATYKMDRNKSFLNIYLIRM